MKLKEFNAENTINHRAGIPAIGVNQKNGLFNINRLATNLMGLKNGDGIVFHQDEKTPQNFYLEKAKDKGFVLREKVNINSGVLFNNSSLARVIGETMKTKESFRLLIAGQPTEMEKRKLWGLIFRKYNIN